MHLASKDTPPPGPARAHLPGEHRAAATIYGALAVAIMAGCFATAFAIASGSWATAGSAAVAICCCALAFGAAGSLYDYAMGIGDGDTEEPPPAGKRRPATHPVFHDGGRP